MNDDITSFGLRALIGEGLRTPAPVEPATVHVGDTTVITFKNAEEWTEAAEERGLKIINRGEDGEDELFAEKAADDDITVIGYFKEDWGMLV